MRKINIILLMLCVSMSVSSYGQKMQNFPNNPYLDFVDTRALILNPPDIAASMIYTTSYSDQSQSGWGGSIINNIGALQNQLVVKADPYDACITGPLNNAAAVYGNICLIQRGTCEFGEKAKKAQDAGAKAVIIVNNIPGDPVGMGAGQAGASVTIPVIMVSQAQGALIEAKLNASTPVNMSFTKWGNGKANDLSLVESGLSLWHSHAIPYNMIKGSGNPTAFKGKDGAVIANFGSAAATNVKLKTTVTWTPKGGSGTVVYTDSAVVAANFAPGDSIITPFMDKEYDLNPTGEGMYKVMYRVSSDQTDQFPGDDTMSYYVHITDRVYSKARYDFTQNHPIARVGYRSGGDNVPLIWGPAYFAKNADYAIEQVNFSIAATGIDLGSRGTFFALVYKWVDGAQGLPQDQHVQAGEVELIGTGSKTYAAGDSSYDFFAVNIKDAGTGTKVVATEANTWYWVAIGVPGSTASDGIYVTCDGELNYFMRQWARAKSTNSYYENYAPIGINKDISNISSTPTETFVNSFAGTAGDNVDSVRFVQQKDGVLPSISMHTSLFTVGVEDVDSKNAFELNIYPNPVTTVLNANINLDKEATLTYFVMDLAGRTFNYQQVDNVKQQEISISTNTLAPGTYYLVVDADGQSMTRKFTVLK